MAEDGVISTKSFYYGQNDVSIRPGFEQRLSNCANCASTTGKGDPETVNVAKIKVKATITHKVAPGQNFSSPWKKSNTGIGYKIVVNNLMWEIIPNTYGANQLAEWFPEIEPEAAQDVINVLYKGLQQKQSQVEAMIKKSLQTSNDDSFLAFASDIFVNKFKKLQDFTEYQNTSYGDRDVTFYVHVAVVPKSFNVCKSDKGRSLVKFKEDGKKCTYFNADILDSYTYQVYIPTEDSTVGRSICQDYFASTSKTKYCDNNLALPVASLAPLEQRILDTCALARSNPGVVYFDGIGISANVDSYTSIGAGFDGEKHYIGLDCGFTFGPGIDSNGSKVPYIGKKFVRLQGGNITELPGNVHTMVQMVSAFPNGFRQVFIDQGIISDEASNQNAVANTVDGTVGNTTPNINPATPVATPTPTRIEQVPASSANTSNQSGAQTRTGDTPITAPAPSIPRPR
jgi:hypothetical protein